MKKREAVEFCQIHYHDEPRILQRVVMRAYLLGEYASHWFQGHDRKKYLTCLRDFKQERFMKIAKYVHHQPHHYGQNNHL